MKKVQQVCIALALFFFSVLAVQAQKSKSPPPAHAITNVTIHFNDSETIEDGTIVWRNGIIQAVGKDVKIPFDAYVIDGGDSLHVYPGFIDGLALWGSPGRPDVDEPERPGNPGYKRAGIQPQRHPHELLQEDESFKKAVKLGFTTAALGLKGEMLPGQVDIFFIQPDKQTLFKDGIAVLAQFEGARGAAYPSTVMGVMAKFKQLWYNAKALQQHIEYYREAGPGYPAPDHSEVLEALFPVMNGEKPYFFVANSEEYIQRVFWLQEELGFEVVLISGKQAYEKAEKLNRKDIPVLASIELPEEPEWRQQQKKEEEKPDIEGVEITEEERLFRQRQLAAYKAYIKNVKQLIETGVKVGYVSYGMDLDEFRDHLLTLHQDVGMSAQQILEVLTENTAEILGIGNRVGSLKEGYIASFSVFTEPFLEEETEVYYSVSNGEITEFEIEPKSEESEEKEEE